MKNTTYVQTLNRQYGGALVESILIFGALTVFMIGIPMMGTVVDVKQKAIQASRYTAWEKTVENSSAPQPNQVDARFFRDEAAPISSTRHSDDLLGTNTLWGEFAQTDEQGVTPTNEPTNETGESEQAVVGDNMQLYQRARVTADASSVVATSEELADESLIFTKIGGVVSKVGRFLSEDGWDPGNPKVNGLLTSNVKIQIENNTFINGGGTVSESTAILTDGWSAADSDTISERVH